jgi:RND family efflux transporter MFP subunit
VSQPKSSKFLYLLITLAVAVVAAGLIHRHFKFKEATEVSQELATRRVAVVHPFKSDRPDQLLLPGRLEGYITASIYSRVNGYLKQWNHDIGARVKAGDVLAIIDSPETDQQFEQAQADLKAATEAEKLAQVNLARAQELLSREGVSQQEVDQRRVELSAKKAYREIAESNLVRARKFLEYKKILAPFDGLVAERNTDIGVLVNNSGGKPLFVVLDASKLRLYVRIPQFNVNDIRAGDKVGITVPEYPGKEFNAQVVRTSGVVSENTGTSLVEVEVPNTQHGLKAGSFAQVNIKLPGNAASLRLSAATLMFRKNGVFVAKVTADSKVVFVPVQIIKDHGPEVEVAGDLQSSDAIVNNPSDTLLEHEAVVVLAEAKK